MASHRIIQGDCIEGLRTLPDASVHCCVTSPPYWGLRDYGHDGQIGLEATPESYVARMVEVFREVRRVLREDGTCWVNLGDSYNSAASGQNGTSGTLGGGKPCCGKGTTAGRRALLDSLKPKDLVGIPWRVAFALQADGWWLRQDIIWHKPNPMPESVRDRCTKAHEYVFLLTKSERYYYDAEAVSEAASSSSGWAKQRASGVNTWKYNASEERVAATGQRASETQGFGKAGTRNRRSVWTVTTKPYSGAHFAVMPADLVEPCIKAGCPEQCCSVCGAGYERITAKQKRFESGSGRSGNAIEGKQDLSAIETNSTPDIRMGPVVSVTTLGWQPACDCAATGTIPGTVLDPFAGSGTTLAVAAELGRSGIGCELNPEYIELAEQRIAKSKAKMPLFVA
jgi:site-specific DNA-methyltransferase (adenine-specific)